MSDQSVIDAMEKARERLGASQALLDTEFYTDSVSRSYYAIFDSARALLITEDILPKTHSGTLRKFSELFIKTAKLTFKMRQPVYFL